MKNKLTIRKCKNCKKEFQKQRFAQSDCFECIVIKAKEKVAKDMGKAKIKNEKEFQKKCRDEKKVWYCNNKRLPKLKKEARAEFQLWVRLRDKEKPCISCNRTEAKQWDGGHYLKAEIYSGLIFHESNCHKQCSYCNDQLRGAVDMYRDGLIIRYGEQYVNDLELIKNGLRQYKYTKDELIKIKQHYKLKIKQLKQ